MKLKASKCHLFQTQVTLLAFVVGPKGVLPDPNNVAKLIA